MGSDSGKGAMQDLTIQSQPSTGPSALLLALRGRRANQGTGALTVGGGPFIDAQEPLDQGHAIQAQSAASPVVQVPSTPVLSALSGIVKSNDGDSQKSTREILLEMQAQIEREEREYNFLLMFTKLMKMLAPPKLKRRKKKKKSKIQGGSQPARSMAGPTSMASPGAAEAGDGGVAAPAAPATETPTVGLAERPKATAHLARNRRAAHTTALDRSGHLQPPPPPPRPPHLDHDHPPMAPLKGHKPPPPPHRIKGSGALSEVATGEQGEVAKALARQAAIRQAAAKKIGVKQAEAKDGTRREWRKLINHDDK